MPIESIETAPEQTSGVTATAANVRHKSTSHPESTIPTPTSKSLSLPTVAPEADVVVAEELQSNDYDEKESKTDQKGPSEPESSVMKDSGVKSSSTTQQPGPSSLRSMHSKTEDRRTSTTKISAHSPPSPSSNVVPFKTVPVSEQPVSEAAPKISEQRPLSKLEGKKSCWLDQFNGQADDQSRCRILPTRTS